MEVNNSLLGMFDSFWFNHEILKNSPHPTSPEETPDEKNPETSTPQILPGSSAYSMDGLGLVGSSIERIENYLSPCSVLSNEKLQTVFSGKQVRDEEEDDENSCDDTEEEGEMAVTVEEVKQIGRMKEEDEMRSKRKRKKMMLMRMKKRGMCKSLSDLEFEEVKGFEELGFVFSDEARNSYFLASILPGLQRLGREEERQTQEVEEQEEGGKEGEGKLSKSVDGSGVSRPFPSKVWWDDVSVFSEGDKKSSEKENVTLTMRPENLPVHREMDMKNYLRNWAHSVAASVR